LLARRLLERGVRFVQVWSGAGGPKDNWDNHADIRTELPAIARQVDQPAAALLQDLKERGLLANTLVVWSTEFGRQPFTQGATGRDHNGGTSVAWLAGAGIKPGVAHGESDEWSWRAGEGKVDGHDIHATILHLLGIDHERLTVRHDGTDRRLTDVHGRVIDEILA
jgi:arylsulfatase A-like enzyme